MPRLYSAISAPSLVRLIELWASRSGILPLSVSIKNLYFDGSPVYNALVMHGARIQLLHAKMSSKIFKYLQPLKGKISLLQSIHLDTDDSRSDFDWTSMDMFSTAPNLRCVTLNKAFHHYLPLPWIQITQYTVDLLKWKTLDHLQQVPNVVTLEAKNVFVKWGGTCTFSQLESLHVTATRRDYGPALDLLNHLICPALRTLHIESSLAVDGGICDSVSSFIRRSGKLVQRLVVSIASLREGDIIDWLGALPSLRDLKVETYERLDLLQESQSTIFDHLTLRNGKPNLAPQLRSLIIRNCPAITTADIVNMVNSRWLDPPSGVSRLSVVKIYFSDADVTSERTIQDWVDELQLEGLDIQLYSAEYGSSFESGSDSSEGGFFAPILQYMSLTGVNLNT